MFFLLSWVGAHLQIANAEGNKANGRRPSHWLVCYRNLGARRKFSKGVIKHSIDLQKLWQTIESIGAAAN